MKKHCWQKVSASGEEVACHIASQLANAGLRRGGVVFVHSSLRALGAVPGGAETVIQALLSAIGDAGTLLLPAFSYRHVTPAHPFFDREATPSNVGALAEYFRTRPGTIRSIHPTHSICGIGQQARKLIDQHVFDCTPCGPHSPLSLLPKLGGQILMLGCGLAPNTSMHGVEELVEPPYLFGPDMAYQFHLPGNQVASKVYRPHSFAGWKQRYDRLERFLPPEALRVREVLGAETHILEAAAVWEIGLKILRQNPQAFVEPISSR
jgi:aminoglycoside 3-N-acetyltransferase